MCNKVHKENDFIEIPEHGFGLKLFTKSGPELLSLIEYAAYKPNNNNEVVWDEMMVSTEYSLCDENLLGFCFFPTSERKMANFASGYFNWSVVKRIEYWSGIGSFIEHGMIKLPVRIAICKKFRICEFV